MTTDIAKHLKMVHSLEAGIFDGIACPQCGKNEVSAWFTNPTVYEYRTWFVCVGCGYSSNISNEGKPKMFRANRIHPELQKRNEATVKDRKFPPPIG